MTPDGFPERLRSSRTARGLSYRGLARKGCGCADVVLPGYEAATSSPRIDRVAALARALDVSAPWLAFGEEGQAADDGAALHVRLRMARSAAALRQQDLATAADLTQVSIGKIEAGERLPRLDVAAALARALRVRPAWLAFGVGEMSRS